MEKGKSSRSSSYLPTTTTPEKTSHQPQSPEEQSPSKSVKRLLTNSFPSLLPKKIRNLLFIVAALGNLALSLWIVIEHGNLPELFTESFSKEHEARKCHLPELHPNSPELRNLLREPERIDCSTSANTDYKGRIWFKLDENQNLVKITHPPIPCCYRPFYRVNDNEVWIEPTKDRRYVCHNITEAVTPIPEEYEYIEVICDNGVYSYKDAFPFLRKKLEVEERVHQILENDKSMNPYVPAAERMSVLIIGMDSTSQQNFVRKMPKSFDYVNKVLNGIRLDGYVKVGEATLDNTVPLLMGLGKDEFKDLCVMKNPPMEQAVHLDSCPFVWKRFKENGYRTIFAEDEVNTGIFNLYWSHAFLEAPTDHYLRPYSLRMVTSQNVYDGFCFGPRMSFQVLLDYLEKAGRTYLSQKNEHIFHFTWASKLMHDDPNRLGWGDQYLVKTLRKLHESGELNNTALFLMSDHGSRVEDLRKTRQGQLEDRLPLAWIVLPPWFENKYPDAIKNLRANAKLITSAYDLHETFQDFMDLKKLNDPHTHYMRQRKLKVAEKKGHRRGTSLFTSLPEHRGCTSAGIPPAWCICYKKKKISVKSLDVHDAVAFTLRQLNSQLAGYRGVCENLKLSRIISSLKWHPEEAIQDTWNGNKEESYKKATLLQLDFMANKDQAHFGVTVIFDPDHGWKFTEQVVRLDRYDEHSRCMQNKELKKLCLCMNPDIPPENKDAFLANNRLIL